MSSSCARADGFERNPGALAPDRAHGQRVADGDGGVTVDQNQVRAQTGPDAPAVGQAESVCRRRGRGSTSREPEFLQLAALSEAIAVRALLERQVSTPLRLLRDRTCPFPD